MTTIEQGTRQEINPKLLSEFEELLYGVELFYDMLFAGIYTKSEAARLLVDQQGFWEETSDIDPKYKESTMDTYKRITRGYSYFSGLINPVFDVLSKRFLEIAEDTTTSKILLVLGTSKSQVAGIKDVDLPAYLKGYRSGIKEVLGGDKKLDIKELSVVLLTKDSDLFDKII